MIQPNHPHQYGAEYSAPFGRPGVAYHPVAHRAGIAAACMAKPAGGYLDRVTIDVPGGDGWFRIHDCAEIGDANIGNLVLQLSSADAEAAPNRSMSLQFHTGLVVSSVTDGGVMSLGFSV